MIENGKRQVAIVIPTYNRGARLPDAIEGALAQGPALAEVIENPELARFSSLFPRMRAAVELRIATARLHAEDPVGCQRDLLAALRVEPAIALDPVFAMVAVRSLLPARANRAVTKLGRSCAVASAASNRLRDRSCDSSKRA